MLNISLQLCVGFLFLILYPRPPPPPPPPPSNHTIFHTSSLPTIFVNHHPSFTHHLSHIIFQTFSNTIFHTSLSTTIFLTPHHLLHTPSFTHHLSHTILATPTSTSRGRRGTWRHPPWFHVAGVALGGIHLGFAWQAWHLATSTFVSRGRSGTCNHIHLRFAWQNWDLVTAVLRGRIGTWLLPLAFCVAGVTWRSLFVSHTSFTHIFVRRCLSHTTLSHTIFHTPSFTVQQVQQISVF